MSGHLSLKWNNHSSSLLRSLTKVQSKEQYCDATIACQGKYFPVHRIVLSTCSEYFEEIFERIQNQHPYIIFKDIEPREMELLLNYMYQGEVNVLQEHLPLLIKAAEALKIKGLAVPDDIPVKEPPPTKKRSNNSNDYPQAKRRTEEKRKRRESNEGHSSNDNEESYSSESYAKNLPKTDHSEELKVIKDEPIDTGYEDNDISKNFEIPIPITEGKITDSENKIQDFSSLENVTYTKDGNIVQNEPFENQSSSWSTYSEGEQIGNLSVQDDARTSAAGATSENESGACSSVDGNASDEGDGLSDNSRNEIELVFRPHPLEMNEDNELIRELKESSIRYIKTTENATVNHLSKYLALRLSLATCTGELETELHSSLDNFCIYVAPTPDHYIVLSGSLTLEQVNEKYWRVSKPMEMFYSWKKN